MIAMILGALVGLMTGGLCWITDITVGVPSGGICAILGPFGFLIGSPCAYSLIGGLAGWAAGGIGTVVSVLSCAVLTIPCGEAIEGMFMGLGDMMNGCCGALGL